MKLSVLHLYISIFRKRDFRRACYVTIFISVLYYVGFILQVLLSCQPISYFWDKSDPNGWCVDLRTTWVVQASVNMAIDILVVSLPMPVLWRLQMSEKKKIYVSLIFGLGIM